MPEQNTELIVIIIAGTIMLLLLGIFIISFLFFYQRKHNSFIGEQEQLESTFRQELLKTQLEVQEQTLTHVSREIHDNVSQVLFFVKINLSMLGDLSNTEKDRKIGESRKLIGQVITDLRDLSKSLSFEHIVQQGLVKTIEIEVEKVSKSGILDIDFTVDGEVYSLGEQRELVLFRILQEAINNVLKHAGARHLKISLQYSEQLFNLTIEDDGVGFYTDMPGKGGSGLKNMQNRAALVGAAAVINSQPGKGCCITVTIDPLSQQIYANGIYPNSPG